MSQGLRLGLLLASLIALIFVIVTVAKRKLNIIYYWITCCICYRNIYVLFW